MNKSIFITGTDTNVGKTYVSCLLLSALNHAGYKTFALKPVASGGEKNNAGKLVNQDALLLQSSASIKRTYDIVNPIVFENPIAPHLAAKQENTNLTQDIVCRVIQQSVQQDADINLIEGVGGWAVPLNDRELLADVVIQLNIPVILVVGIKLGCLNHTILTHQHILARGGRLIGWVANCLDRDALVIAGNINTLKQWLAAPCLGVVAYDDKSITGMNIHAITDTLF